MISTILIEAAKGAVVGGIIGYATNQLAVWMLFHPRAEKKFLGIRIPLTPGLVVKNKDRIADSIGRSVGNDLLDTATLADYLRKVDLATPIHRILMEEYRSLGESNKRLSDVLGLSKAENLASIRETIIADLYKKLLSLSADSFRSDSTENPIIGSIENELLEAPLGRLLPSDRAGLLARWIEDRISHFLTSDHGGDLLSKAIDNAVAKLPDSPAMQELESFLLTALRPSIPKLAENIQEAILAYIASEQFEQQASGPLAERLYTLIVEKFPMAKMLVTQQVIMELLQQRWPDIVEEIQKIARRDELKIYMAQRVETGIGELGSSLGDALSRPEVRSHLSALLVRETQTALNSIAKGGEIGKGISSFLEQNREKPVREVIGADASWIRALISELLRKIPDWLESEPGRQWGHKTIGGIIDHALLNKPVGELVAFLPEKDWDSMSGALARLFEDRAHRVLPRILEEQVDLASLVTEKIRDFDPVRVEEAIVRVSGRELSGIVRLGGLIGILVGAATQVAFFLFGQS